jgi:protein ImuB
MTMRRYVSIWFPNLLANRLQLRDQELAKVPFVFAAKQRGRMVVMAASHLAQQEGIHTGMVVADARAILPELNVVEFDPTLSERLLNALAEWAIRYTPLVAIDLPDGLLLDATGCAHLWGGERAYLTDLVKRLKVLGFYAQVAMTDTIGASWALCRYAGSMTVSGPGEQINCLPPLPAQALRLEPQVVEKLAKVGLTKIKSFIGMPPSVLRRRFGQPLLDQLGKALGDTYEAFKPIHPIEPYQHRLPSMEPILTATGIAIAIKTLLELLCLRLAKETKGLRKAVLKCYRVDGEIQQVEIGTSSPSCNSVHLFRLFELKISSIEPALGIELFVLDAYGVEDLPGQQETIWNVQGENKLVEVAELLDRLAMRTGTDAIHRYLPAEHYWPERSITEAATLTQVPQSEWRSSYSMPVQLLAQPEKILVTAPVPDYPPMVFRYKGTVYKIKRADGPDRIEQEWWISDGLHRDYYCVEDENGGRYWIFRSGHYGDNNNPDWFIHGFLA